MRLGECGHRLRDREVHFDGEGGATTILCAPYCRVCLTAEGTTEACNARALKAKPQTFTVKVTSVTPAPPGTYGPGDYGPDSFGGSDFPDVADVSGFVPGMAVDFVDGSHLRAQERDRWRGREAEANAWVFMLPRSVMKRLLATMHTTTVGDIAEVHAAENAMRHLGLTFSRHEALMAWEITVDSGESRAFVEAVLDSERAQATRDLEAAWGAELATVRLTLAAMFGPANPPDGADARIGHTWSAVERALQRVVDGPPIEDGDDAWRPPHIDEVDDVLREVGWQLVSETLPPLSRRRGMFRAERMKTYAEVINEPHGLFADVTEANSYPKPSTYLKLD